MKKPSHSRSGRLQELKLFALLAQHFHVEVAVDLDPILVDFDGEGANKSERAFLIGEDANDMGAAFNLLIEPFQHIGALEMLVVFSRQAVEGQSFFNVLFNPHAELGILLLPAQQPGGEISASLLGVAAIVEPAQFDQAIVGAR